MPRNPPRASSRAATALRRRGGRGRARRSRRQDAGADRQARPALAPCSRRARPESRTAAISGTCPGWTICDAERITAPGASRERSTKASAAPSDLESERPARLADGREGAIVDRARGLGAAAQHLAGRPPGRADPPCEGARRPSWSALTSSLRASPALLLDLEDETRAKLRWWRRPKRIRANDAGDGGAGGDDESGTAHAARRPAPSSSPRTIAPSSAGTGHRSAQEGRLEHPPAKEDAVSASQDPGRAFREAPSFAPFPTFRPAPSAASGRRRRR